jgi:hypothetical protein
VNAEFFRTAQGFARELDDHPSVVRLRHLRGPLELRHSLPIPKQTQEGYRIYAPNPTGRGRRLQHDLRKSPSPDLIR